MHVLSIGIALAVLRVTAAYNIVRDYSGATFFSGWDFYGSWDNLTNGDVWWLDQKNASQSGLVSVNSEGNAIMKVDDTSYVPFNQKRNSVRITSQQFFNFGSLWIVDMVHMPFGCSVWPAFWSKGRNWPEDGEIDIIEGINLMSSNQMALHTTEGCSHSTPPNQLGQSAGLGPGNVGGNGTNSDGTDAADCSTGAGCTVLETKPNSFGQGFADNGGGVFATQFDVAGIFLWFWPRDQIPESIQQATSSSSVDLSDWGNPSASYTNESCVFEDFFTPQQLIFDITLCGDWAGLGSTYNATCGSSGPTGICYTNNVVGSGANYDDAYFEIKYLRAYTTVPPGTQPTAVVGVIEHNSAAALSNPKSGNRAAWAAGAWVSVMLCILLGSMTVV